MLIFVFCIIKSVINYKLYKMAVLNKYGFIKGTILDTDLKFAPKFTASSLPNQIDWINSFPAIYDQKTLGSCVLNATGALFEREQMILHALGKAKSVFKPSRLFAYWNTRKIEGSPTDQDTGCQIKNAIQQFIDYGICPESQWPYEPDFETNFAIEPPKSCFDVAKWFKATKVVNVNQDPISLKSALAQGHPFAFGIQVYESFESQAVATSGIVPMPDVNNEQLLGGHGIAAVGYIANAYYICRNSWGNWGKKGYFYLPSAYVESQVLSSDFWHIDTILGN